MKLSSSWLPGLLVVLVSTTSTVAGMVLGPACLVWAGAPVPFADYDASARGEHFIKHSDSLWHVQTLRYGVARFVGERGICCGEGTANLETWSQLTDYLEAVEFMGSEDDFQGATLRGRNAWGGDFVLVVDPGVPRAFEIRINSIDVDSADALARGLTTGALRVQTVPGRDNERSADVRVVYGL